MTPHICVSEEQDLRFCPEPDCSAVLTGRQKLCKRCRGRLKKQRNRKHRRQALALAERLDAEARLRLSGSQTEVVLAEDLRAEETFEFFRALMESNGDRWPRRVAA